MKLSYISLGFIVIVFASFIRTQSSVKINSDIDCKTVIDCANIYIQSIDFGINVKPTKVDDKLALRLDRWFRTLPFKSLACLLNSDNVSHKFFGFTYAAMMYKDSLLKNYAYLLADTATIRMYTTSGMENPQMKLGQVLSLILQSAKKDDDDVARRPEIERTVSTFIAKYAKYPGTYKSISFPYYSIGSESSKEETVYTTYHEFELKNNKGKNEHVTYAFVMKDDLKINVIEKDSTRTISSYPPKLESWLNEFGRKLSTSDSLALGIR